MVFRLKWNLCHMPRARNMNCGNFLMKRKILIKILKEVCFLIVDNIKICNIQRCPEVSKQFAKNCEVFYNFKCKVVLNNKYLHQSIQELGLANFINRNSFSLHFAIFSTAIKPQLVSLVAQENRVIDYSNVAKKIWVIDFLSYHHFEGESSSNLHGSFFSYLKG